MTKKKLKKKNKKKPANNGQITEKPTNTKLNIVTNTITMPPSVLTPPATPSPANSNESLNNNKNNNIIINKEDVMSVPQRKAWERELIGSFLLNMADNQVISGKSDWYVDKGNMRRKFEKLLCAKPQGPELRVKLNVNGPYNIGALLFSTNFLMNTPRGDSNYRIKSVALMDYRREKYNAMDEIQRRSDHAAVSITTDATDKNNEPLTQRYKLDENAKSLPLKYQKTQEQQCDNKFELSSWGCYICQCNFDSIEKYEEHIEYHGDESDFQSLQKMTKRAQPMLNLSYQTCVDSHYFGFTLATQLKDIVIEKIIIVLLRQFYYVDNNRLPLQVSDDGQLVFFVDSHVFMILREQPIVIGFSQLVNGKRQHYVEQHHFMRTEELPKASFNVNPYRLSKEKTFRGGRLNPAVPAEKVLAALKLNPQDVQVQLAEYNADYRDYCELGRDLTQKNFYGALGTLLQLEDIEQLQCYVSLTQYKMDLHQFGRELSVKIQPSMRSSSIEDVLSPGDSVLIINEGKTNGVRKLLEDSDLILKLTLMDYDALIAWGHKITEKFGAADKERKEPRVYFAHILAVSTQRVNITCDRKLPDNTTFSLIFRPIRAVLRYQYRALEQLKLTNADHVQRLLFPHTIEEQLMVTGKFTYYNKNINGNPEQQTAVKQIALTPTLPAPYIIFGPPGTGKTATICEAITQLYIGRPETRILVLAGSNTACDEVALRLLRSISKTPSQAHPLVRVFSASCDRRVDNIDDLLLEYSNMYGMHFYPDVQAVHDYRIVVCTLSLAGKLSTGGFGRDENKRNVFTHVFVDEAAASTEAELLMGITSTISATTNLILSGDHKQLGPVLQSQRALDWGLGVSLFERLMQRECYRLDENGDYNKAIQTRLRRNYRSHPEIVALYNNLYYDGELISEASLKRVCLAKNWFHTTNEEFPIMFHSVFGTTMNTQNSISLCNNKEIDVVMDYVKDLMYFGINGKKVAQTDIGIISPYKSQYQRIQEQLNMRSWHQIDCGSVELFQGKEKQIIIVSFVRSFTEKLGFLNNNRRLNVLLSRPMSLLILIGNPRTLSKNDDFRHIIDVCRAHKTLVGSNYYPDNDKLNETNNHKNGYRQATAANTSDAPTLAQKFKRTTTNNKPPISTAAAKMVYNKDELLKLGAKKEKPAIKSELEQLFDDLPSVPRYVDHDSDAVRSIQKDMENLTINKETTAAAATSSRATCPNTTVSSLNAARLSGLAAGSTSRPIFYATEAHESMHAPSAPPASPSPRRPISTYSHIPSGSSRFEQVRPPHRLQDEYQRPPPFYYSSPYASAPPPPKPEKKKNTCVVS